MIILGYGDWWLVVTNGKWRYRYYMLTPPVIRRIRTLVKRGFYGSAWSMLKWRKCYEKSLCI